jgi:hypothetical protein
MSKFVKEQYENLAKISNRQAKKYLLEHGYFTEMGLLPSIIEPSGIDKIKLQEIDWKKKDFLSRTKAIRIVSSKDQKGERIFGLIHPYSYIHIVNEITKKDSWEDIRSRLSSETDVLVYSVPLLGKQKKSGWEYFSFFDLQELSLNYDVQLHIDIQNFYGSIYTHSIAWASLGKEVAKNKINNYSLSGNRLDKLFQNSNDGQTNGILVGNEASNIIAELILKDVDEKISKVLKQFDIKILRYRDDYRILCKNRQDAIIVQSHISLILSEEYGFVLNGVKTKIYEQYNTKNILAEHSARCILGRYLVDNSDEILKWNGERLYHFLNDMVQSHNYLQDKHYLDNKLSKLLGLLRSKKLNLKDVESHAKIIVNLIIKSISNKYLINTYSLAFLEEFIFVLKKENEDLAREIVEIIYNFYEKNGSDIIDLWLYVICKRYDESYAKKVLAKNNNPIFKMIQNKNVADINFFESRDKISSKDLKELEKFKLFDFSILEEIIEKDTSFLENIDEDLFTEWISPIYNR